MYDIAKLNLKTYFHHHSEFQKNSVPLESKSVFRNQQLSSVQMIDHGLFNEVSSTFVWIESVYNLQISWETFSCEHYSNCKIVVRSLSRYAM